MTAVTSTGFTRTRLDERFAELQDAMRAIFGPDIKLDADTIDGQTIGIYSEAISNLDQLAEDVYQGFNPQSATGLALSRLVQLNGIRRIAGAYTTATVRCVGTQGTVIPAGSLVSNPTTGDSFATLAAVTIPEAGEIEVEVRASAMGAILAPAGSITKIDSPTFGWQTVTNPSDAAVGRNEETDSELRVRRAKSTATPAQAVLDALYGAIMQVDGVTQARVFENDQDVADANGQAPHSVYCLVEGGEPADIAAAIWNRKTLGTTSIGDIEEAVIDAQGNPHTIRFSRPTDVDLYIVVNVTTRSGWPTDGAQRIKSALVAWCVAEQEIGELLIYSRLYSPINTVPGFSITSLTVGLAPSPTGTTDIPIGFDEIARIDSSRITVNVTTP